MQPKSFSASALHVAELCLSRYRAENIERSRGPGGTAASLGTSVHGALELYVQAKMLGGDPDLKYLLDMFRMSYMTTFGTADTNTEDFEDGVEMLTKWHKRTDWTGVKILSCEVKENFMVKTSIGDIPFNYIWDRHDQIGENEYKVIDYKTNRWGINPQDLKKKIQARSYGLAAQIKYPNAERIWVEFDMLRHDGPVGIVFTREENAATWRFIKEKAEEIIRTADEDVEERLNGECLFCVRKQECTALLKNISVGGIFGVGSAVEAIDRRAQLEYQAKAVSAAIRELDEVIIAEAKKTDTLEFESDLNRMFITASLRRSVDGDMVERVIGPQLFDKYGGRSFTIGSVDKLLKGSEITDDQKRQLRGLIYSKRGEPSVKVEPKNPIDGD